MKCIRAIRESKGVELGEIRRVDDKTAHSMVGISWEYVSKSEWKTATRKQKQVVEKVEEVSETTDKRPYKKGQKSEIHKNKK